MEHVLFENEHFLVINKPPACHFDECLATLRIIGDWIPAHRLDFETSGALLFTRPQWEQATRALFKDPASSLRKIYVAGASRPLPPQLVTGFQTTGWIGSRYRSSKKVRFAFQERAFLGWHSVREVIHVVRPWNGPQLSFTGTLYEIELLTGARHQIRAFFASQNAPLVGDPIYGKAGQRLELHSWKLELDPPFLPGLSLRVEAPIRSPINGGPRSPRGA